jgi:hypothetical protein
MSMGASQPMGTTQRPRYNRFKAVCYKCGSWCAPAEGVLESQSQISGQWKVACIDTSRCAAQVAKATPPKRRGASAKSTDNLTNMLD